MPEKQNQNARKYPREFAAEYSVWRGILQRCRDVNSKIYKYYGGRGITVCKKWADSFMAFVEDVGRRPSPKHQLDREKNNLNYEPGNCRWTTSKVNNRNRRNNRMITHNGITKCLAEWAEDAGLKFHTLQARIGRLGWDFERAITTPCAH